MDDPDKMMHSLTSIVASCKYCGMETYSESLAYEKRLTESNNDSSLDKDTVTPLSKLNSKIFQHYKENLKNGVFPPVEVVYDGNIGFLVKTLAPMKKHTILTEYVGEVTTIDQTGNTSSDSLMSLLQTGGEYFINFNLSLSTSILPFLSLHSYSHHLSIHYPFFFICR